MDGLTVYLLERGGKTRESSQQEWTKLQWDYSIHWTVGFYSFSVYFSIYVVLSQGEKSKHKDSSNEYDSCLNWVLSAVKLFREGERELLICRWSWVKSALFTSSGLHSRCANTLFSHPVDIRLFPFLFVYDTGVLRSHLSMDWQIKR